MTLKVWSSTPQTTFVGLCFRVFAKGYTLEKVAYKYGSELVAHEDNQYDFLMDSAMMTPLLYLEAFNHEKERKINNWLA